MISQRITDKDCKQREFLLNHTMKIAGCGMWCGGWSTPLRSLWQQLHRMILVHVSSPDKQTHGPVLYLLHQQHPPNDLPRTDSAAKRYLFPHLQHHVLTHWLSMLVGIERPYRCKTHIQKIQNRASEARNGKVVAILIRLQDDQRSSPE